MLLPLAIGLVLKARFGDLAARVKPGFDWISNVSLILLICLITQRTSTKSYKYLVPEESLRGFCLSIGTWDWLVARRT
jgi:predicted Na+-dependent transporter